MPMSTEMPMSTTMSSDGFCGNSTISGVEAFGVCCPAACGICGGPGCADRAKEADLDSQSCCVHQIYAAKVYCTDTEAAPCIMGDTLPEEGVAFLIGVVSPAVVDRT